MSWHNIILGAVVFALVWMAMAARSIRRDRGRLRLLEFEADQWWSPLDYDEARDFLEARGWEENRAMWTHPELATTPVTIPRAIRLQHEGARVDR